MKMTAEQTVSDTFVAVTPETKTVTFATRRLNRE